MSLLSGSILVNLLLQFGILSISTILHDFCLTCNLKAKVHKYIAKLMSSLIDDDKEDDDNNDVFQPKPTKCSPIAEHSWIYCSLQ